MAVLARLSTILDADTAKFDAGFKRAGKLAGNFGGLVAKATKAAAVGIGAAATALGALTVRQALAIDQTAKLARSLGVGLREFQAIALVADEAGIAQEGLGKAIQTSQKAIFEAANGMATYKRSFDQLGISLDDLNGLSPDKQFNMIAEALGKVDDATARTSIALSIFGRNGRDLINVLDDYNGRLQEAKDFNDKFGLSINEIDSTKIEEANDTFARVGRAVSGLGNVLAVEFAPIITAISNAFIDGGLDAETFGNLVRRSMEIAAFGIDVVRKAFIAVRLLIAEGSHQIDRFIIDTTKNLFTLAEAAATLPGIGDAMRAVQAELLALNQGAAELGQKNFENLKKLRQEVADFVPLADRLAKIQAEANQRAAETVRKQKEMIGIGGGIDTENTTRGFKKYADSVDDAKKKTLDYNKMTADSFKQIGQAFANGEKLADSFKRVAINAITKIAESAIDKLDFSFGGKATKSGGGAAGGIFGGLFGGLFDSVASGVGGFFKNLFPSFDVGSYQVPGDMLANVHKDEMIIPAKEAAQIRNGGGMGGGGIAIYQNVTIGDNVTAAVRQEIARAMPELKRASVEAVQDAQLRGAM